MNTLNQVMRELKKKGSERYRQVILKHGVPDSSYGVSVADLKVIAKQIKGKQDLALELYASDQPDAMYLAGIVADGSQMTKPQLNAWAKAASWYMISEYTVPGVAAEHPAARDLALKWIRSRTASIAAAGWNTYAGLLATQPDEELDHGEIKDLLDEVVDKIHTAPNRVRYTMNGFVIAVGAYIPDLLRQAKSAAKTIGKVSVDVGDTSCKVPLATDYIAKIEKMGRVGKKRKTVKC